MKVESVNVLLTDLAKREFADMMMLSIIPDS